MHTLLKHLSASFSEEPLKDDAEFEIVTEEEEEEKEEEEAERGI